MAIYERLKWGLSPLIGVTILTVPILLAQQPQPRPSAPAWAEWVEPDFPFFSSVVDAGAAGHPFPALNLTPRALVLNLGGGSWAAFDLDLLRVAAIWHGNGVTPKALAPGSYHAPDKKTPGGQSPAPAPAGPVWMANGVYPGWHLTDRDPFIDPREPAPSPEEVGRGPLGEQTGRFKALRLEPDGVTLDYAVFGSDVTERIARTARPGAAAVERRFRIAPSRQALTLALGSKTESVDIALDTAIGGGAPPTLTTQPWSDPQPRTAASGVENRAVWVAQIPPHSQPLEFSIVITNRSVPSTAGRPTAPSGGGAPAAGAPGGAVSSSPGTARGGATAGWPPRGSGTATSARRRWPQEVTTRVTKGTGAAAYVVDDVALPVDNPWRRNVRPGDVQFLKDGTGVVVTLDGDVWVVRGLHEPAGTARWRRFASGLHEPLTLAIRDEEVHVFDRNGIWRLRDTDGDGEADVHELFSNAFAQTADMREFPSTLRLGPQGEFVIAKGGQEATTLGKHNGSVLRISADGRQATVLGYGFRQPNISVNPRTGLVIASDQQGHYIPTTPLHIVRDRQFYGFLGDKRPREVYPAPIAEPLTWIPHAANASAMSQVWLYGARMGPLNDALVHIGFNNPELFRVLLNERGTRPQAAVVSVTRAFDFPPLNGSVNHADGQLYLAGFQILGWGSTATRLAGLGRVRYTGTAFTGPRELVPMDTGVLVRFDVALDPASAGNADNYSLTGWQYKRTFSYGSPQFKADGTPGIDRLAPSHAYVSNDRRAVFVAVPGLKPVMQMRLGWSLTTATGGSFQDSAYFTPYQLTRFDPRAEGFGDLTVDLTPRALAAATAAPVSAAEGKRLSQLYGCMACHAVDASPASRLGPSWKALYGSQRSYAKGVLRATADEGYLREAIVEPAAKVATGYERGESGMPSYAGVLTDPQIESIILFIKTLK